MTDKNHDVIMVWQCSITCENTMQCLELLVALISKVNNTPSCHLRLKIATPLCSQPVCLTCLSEDNVETERHRYNR